MTTIRCSQCGCKFDIIEGGRPGKEEICPDCGNRVATSAVPVAQEKQYAQLKDQAASLLRDGVAPQAVKQRLIATGVEPQLAELVVGDVVAQNFSPPTAGSAQTVGTLRVIVGGIVLGVGILLFVGNITGLFRTFPFAGYLTIALGAAIMGSRKRASR